MLVTTNFVSTQPFHSFSLLPSLLVASFPSLPHLSYFYSYHSHTLSPLLSAITSCPSLSYTFTIPFVHLIIFLVFLLSSPLASFSTIIHSSTRKVGVAECILIETNPFVVVCLNDLHCIACRYAYAIFELFD